MRPDTATAAQGSSERPLIAFGQFVFDRASGLLARDGREVPLPPRVLGILALLLERPGQLVTKQELMSRVWRDAFVTETSLAEAISVLRQTLGDDPQRPTYIQTLHRRGYRFIAEVQEAHPATAGGHPLAAAPFRNAVSAPVDNAAAETAPRLSLLVPWLITSFAVVITAIAVWKYVNVAAPPVRPAARFTLTLPPGLTLSATGAPVAVSSDGAFIAFAGCRTLAPDSVADRRDQNCAIYLRPLAQAEPTPVAGTAGASSPFFSPDGRWLGYFAAGRLYKLALAGGSPVVLADAPEPLGATWTRDSHIVFAGSATGGLSIVPAGGGAVRSLTNPSGGGHRWPDALPDGSGIVFTVASDAMQANQGYAGLVSLRTRAWGRLLDDVTGVRAPLDGYLVAQRGTDLLGVAFDRRTQSVAGLPTPVASGVLQADGRPQFAIGEAGTLVLGTGGSAQAHVVLDWIGELRRLVPPPPPPLPR